MAEGVLDVVGDVPVPLELTVRPARVNGLLGTGLRRPATSPSCWCRSAWRPPRPGGDDDPVAVVVPTFRPDIRPRPMGEADLAEEVARTYGYARLPRRHARRGRSPAGSPTVPAGAPPAEGRAVRPGGQRGVDDGVRDRGRPAGRRIRPALRRDDQPTGGGRTVPAVVDGPGPAPRAASTTPSGARATSGCSRSGSVFRPPEVPGRRRARAEVVERLCAVFAGERRRRLVGGRRLAHRGGRTGPGRLGARAGPHHDPATRVLHEYRSGTLLGGASGEDDDGRRAVLGVVGELDPTVVESVGLVARTDGPAGWAGSTSTSASCWTRSARPPAPLESVAGQPVPVVGRGPGLRGARRGAGRPVEATLAGAGGELLESVRLFDVYRGESLGEGVAQPGLPAAVLRARPHAHRRGDRRLRAACIAAVEQAHRATLR